MQASKNDKNVAWHNDHRPLHKMTPFRTWPYFIRPWPNSPPKKEKLVMFGSPLGHLWNLPGTPRPLHWPPLTSPDPKRTPQGPPGITKIIRKPQILRIFKKQHGFPSKLIDLDLTNHENVNISVDHWRKSNTHLPFVPGGGSACPFVPPHVQLSGQRVSGQLEPTCQSVV